MSNYYSNSSNNNNFRPPQVSPLAGLKKFFLSKSMLSRLVIINVAVFLVVNIYMLFLYLLQINIVPGSYYDVTSWLAVPSSLTSLWQKPWTLLTYMFLHVQFWHLAMNMLVLYFGGTIFKQYLGEKKLLVVYIIGGLTGAFFYILAFNVFPVFDKVVGVSVALGASASVMAIIIAVATYLPEYPVYLFFFAKVKMKYIAFIYIALDLLSIEKENPGGHIAHLGGALFGFLFIIFLKNNINLSRFTTPIKNLFKPKIKVKYSKEPFKKRPLNDDDYSYQKATHQKKIDSILDKISKSGYESLSKEEKEMLFNSSKK
jgi:membrane associated rhomboid family serine protease